MNRRVLLICLLTGACDTAKQPVVEPDVPRMTTITVAGAVRDGAGHNVGGQLVRVWRLEAGCSGAAHDSASTTVSLYDGTYRLELPRPVQVGQRICLKASADAWRGATWDDIELRADNVTAVDDHAQTFDFNYDFAYARVSLELSDTALVKARDFSFELIDGTRVRSFAGAGMRAAPRRVESELLTVGTAGALVLKVIYHGAGGTAAAAQTLPLRPDQVTGFSVIISESDPYFQQIGAEGRVSFAIETEAGPSAARLWLLWGTSPISRMVIF